MNVDDPAHPATVARGVTARRISTHQAATIENGSAKTVTETVAMTGAGTEIEAHQDVTVDEMTTEARRAQENCLTTAVVEEAAVVVGGAASATVMEVLAAEVVEETETGGSGSGAQRLLPRKRSLHRI